MKIKHKIGFIALITMVDIFVIILVVMTNEKTSIQNDVNTKTSANILATTSVNKEMYTKLVDVIKDESETNVENNEEVNQNIENLEETVNNNEIKTEETIKEEIKQEPMVNNIESTENKVEEQPVEETNVENNEVIEETREEINYVYYDDLSLEEKQVALENGTLALEYSGLYTNSNERLTKSKGVVYYNGHKETYYSERVLPGPGLNIPDRHVAEDGTVRDGDGYICVASDLSYLPKGSILLTSLGPAKVYDTGCAYGTIDIYVNW